ASFPPLAALACELQAAACPRAPLPSTRYLFSYNPLHLRKLCAPEIWVAERLAGINQGATSRVSEVVFRARGMVNAVLATSCRSALERHKLSAQSVIIQKRCGSRINHRQRVLI